MTSFFQFSVPTKIVFSPGLARDFSAELDLLPINRFFVVTDRALNKLGLVDPIIEGIKQSGREVTGLYHEVPPDSSVKVVEEVAKLARESGACGFIAVGGGSVLDTAKGANILFTLGGNLVEDYSGAQTITQDLSPLIAIPTTAGTGSEVTEAVVIYDETTQRKLSFVDYHLLPKLAILDPELTYGLPPLLTAATGMDALTHAIEAMMSVQQGPVSDALALQAIRLIFESLIPAVENGHNLDARGAMLTASTLAGMAFNHAMVGVVHSVAHTMGALFHVHHGTANSIFLPYGMEYNLQEKAYSLASMAPMMGIHQPNTTHEDLAKQVIQKVFELQKNLYFKSKLPYSLKDAGLKKEDILTLAELAPQDGSSFYNPREVTMEDLLPYLERAFETK